jgi:hypothetical protein
MLAKNNRPFTDIEFFKKCMLAVANEVCPEKIKLFEEISLSTRTCVRRTEELGSNIFSQLKDIIIPSLDCFSIAIDESTDISDTAQLLIFMRGIDKEFNVYEELVDMCSIKGTTTGEDIFTNIENSFEKLGLSLKKLISITTDGGKNMSGKNKGFIGRIKTKMIDSKFEMPMVFHCIIHQEALCSKVLAWKNVMDTVVSTINYIRKNGLAHRQFQQFLEEIEADYGDVIYFTEVRWLSRGAALKRFFTLREEINMFMNEKGKNIPQLSDKNWILDLAFLTDITTFLNELNVKLQGKEKLLPDMYSDIKSFSAKLKLFYKHIDEKKLDHFVCCKKAIETFQQCNWEEVKVKFLNIIEKLQNEFSTRFSDFYSIDFKIKLFQNPFVVDIDDVESCLQMEIIELQSDESLKTAFHNGHNLVQFYSSLCEKKFSKIKYFAKQMLSVFGSTYICEQTFSLMKYRKSKYASRLTDGHLNAILRISTSKIKPTINKLVDAIQTQKSH